MSANEHATPPESASVPRIVAPLHGGWLAAAAGLMFLGVALGAFGAHLLDDRLSDAQLERYGVGVRYHLIHGACLLALSLAPATGLLRTARWLLLVGTSIFAGSLYILALSDVRWWGAITPIGGTALLAGWLMLVIAGVRVGRAVSRAESPRN